jgi:hypothetical protein
MPTEEQKMWLVNQVRRAGKLNDDLIGVEIFAIAFLYIRFKLPSQMSP